MVYMRMLRMNEAAKILGLHVGTIQRMDREGRIHCIRTDTGRRRIPESEINRLLGEYKIRYPIGYARVSSHDQKKDLANQIELIKQKYPSIEIYSDIRSGLKFDRKGFLSALNAVREKRVSSVVIVHKDRLSRFGFDLIQEVFSGYGTEIEILIPDINMSPHEELAKDLITIITSFSSRLYGLRSHQTKKLISTAKEVIKSEQSL